MQDYGAIVHTRPYLPPKSGFAVLDTDADALTTNSQYFAAMVRFGPVPKYIRIPEIKNAATVDDMQCVFRVIRTGEFQPIGDRVNYYTLYQLLTYYLCDDLLVKYIAHLCAGVLFVDITVSADQLVQIQQIDEQLDDGPRIVVALFANTTQTSAEFIALGEDLKARLYNWHETAGVSVMDVLTLLQHWRDYVVYDESTSDNSLFLPYVCADIDIFKSVYCPIDTIPSVSRNVALHTLAIVTFPEFHRVFADNSQHILDHMNWANVIAAGGYVLQCLQANMPATGGDIDLFVYGATETIRRATFRRLVLYFAPYKTYYATGGGVTTLCVVGILRNIQIILTSVESIADVLEDFDLDYVQCAYNGVVYMTVDCVLAIKQQCVIRTDGGPSNKRVIKAHMKGFAISTTIGLAKDPTLFYKKLRKYTKRGNNTYYTPSPDVSDARNLYLMSAIFKNTSVYASADKLLKHCTYEAIAQSSDYFAGAKRQNTIDIVANMVFVPHGNTHVPMCGGRLIVFKTNITSFDVAGLMYGAELSICLTGGTLYLLQQIDTVISAMLHTSHADALYDPIVHSYTTDAGERYYMVAAQSAELEDHTVYANNNKPANLSDVRRFAAYIVIENVYLASGIYRCSVKCNKLLTYPAYI